MILSCSDLSKAYGRNWALRDVNLELYRGEVLGLLGPNGAGKSTLIKLICGLIWPSYGVVKVNGYDVHSEHKQALQKLGAIIEWPAFISDLSAKSNLRILSGISGRTSDKRIEEVCEIVGMNAFLQQKVGTFSTGMKQRLGIALALLPNSEIIILDEPTNGLDPKGIVEIRELIKTLNRELQVTILVSSHLLGEVEHICHKVAIINKGKLLRYEKMAMILEQESGNWTLACNNLQKAIEIIAKFDKKAELFRDNELLIYACNKEELAEINWLLVQENLQVWHINKQQQNLEDYFLNEVNQ